MCTNAILKINQAVRLLELNLLSRLLRGCIVGLFLSLHSVSPIHHCEYDVKVVEITAAELPQKIKK